MKYYEYEVETIDVESGIVKAKNKKEALEKAKRGLVGHPVGDIDIQLTKKPDWWINEFEK